MAENPTSSSPIRDLKTPHLFTPQASREAWEARVAELRTQILFSAGLWPLPEKAPLRPRVTGRVEGPDYTIENVALETWPGFYLCGNLYRPKGIAGPFPAVVNPHGHWANGRLEMEEDVPLAAPPPEPPAPGRGNLVAIGVNLARQGFVVFAYDMVGYNDTRQVGHDFAKGLEPWLHGVSLLGLQLWNSIRVTDYLAGLPDVDPGRIGVTGASGGGTQAFLLCGVDQRIQAAVPVNMVSAQMQGGCLCENAPGLRLGTDNVEIAAMFAPKPLLLVSCTGDWTKENPTVEWPAIRKVYDLYDAADRTAVVQFNYGHNYNVESREAMYAWLGRWLRNDPEPSRERPFTVEASALRVWTEEHPLPADALDEPALVRSLFESRSAYLTTLAADSAPECAGGVLRTWKTTLRYALGLEQEAWPPSRTEVRVAAKRRAVIVALKTEQDAVNRLQEALIRHGHEVAWMELESLEAPPVRPAPVSHGSADYFSCYNRTPLGERVREILQALALLSSDADEPLDIVGVGAAGLWTLLARPFWDGSGYTVIDTRGFDTGDAAAYLGDVFAPGLRLAGDFATAGMLVAPAPLCLHNTRGVFGTQLIEQRYAHDQASIRVEKEALSEDAIAAWLADVRSNA